ncbi:unnamed protein product [Cylindrotheca closterium]|uniref:Splicing factor Cactin n=1 Tax=Cylindrotheca closterium TaxID=2856 RepID=A0AAD2FCE9_9STRA|nr:unnamed protein product [Cylindrotheca closterium]
MTETVEETSRRDDLKSRKRGDDDDRKSRKSRRDDDDDRRSRKRRKRSRRDHSSESDDSEDSRRRRRRRKKSSRRKSKKSRKSSRKKYQSSSSSSSSDDDSSSSSDDSGSQGETKKVINEKLLAKLSERGETLEERKERRAQKRAAKIASRFGYTAEENPFNDPNLHETFNWTKKKKAPTSEKETAKTLDEIDNIRRRRKQRDEEKDEMDRTRAEESRQKELENYDEWAKKEEKFHLDQQRKRSAIRLMEGREKPVDVLAKNLLMFGLSEEEKNQQAAVKYKERYNALEQIEKLEAELEEPHKVVGVLKLVELHELKMEIEAFRILEKEAADGKSTASILLYWDALHLVTLDEIKLLQNGGEKSQYGRKIEGIKEIFAGQSRSALMKMQDEIMSKLSSPTCDDRPYWQAVREQLMVHLAKLDLTEMHKKMLVRQLERLEQRKKEAAERGAEKKEGEENDENDKSMVPENVDAEFGNAEEELGETDEIDITKKKTYSWQDRYAPRKPRYFNRVKTGYDWNKYNQTHYDAETPPPKIVQGYSFNIFYPDLVDPTKTPQYFLEPADSDDFCILRFHGGAPYEDIAFKIINREWNRSRKRGFRCTFERGILSLYFNFATHWYRR